ncbi:hypothetical protein QR680_010495 [Steinernema hermaphroditum]|uniref:Transcription factor CBF/NF-Y/archaeal histone domain-containing protein n=1 Tax=Steinernema hermaphroditum TaxID=289476 RepID=A0AA39MBC9_9BILA|nr:hypothetical protein QR680_010495 [Steinernema hermaphroditum]
MSSANQLRSAKQQHGRVSELRRSILPRRSSGSSVPDASAQRRQRPSSSAPRRSVRRQPLLRFSQDSQPSERDVPAPPHRQERQFLRFSFHIYLCTFQVLVEVALLRTDSSGVESAEAIGPSQTVRASVDVVVRRPRPQRHQSDRHAPENRRFLTQRGQNGQNMFFDDSSFLDSTGPPVVQNEHAAEPEEVVPSQLDQVDHPVKASGRQSLRERLSLRRLQTHPGPFLSQGPQPGESFASSMDDSDRKTSTQPLKGIGGHGRRSIRQPRAPAVLEFTADSSTAFEGLPPRRSMNRLVPITPESSGTIFGRQSDIGGVSFAATQESIFSKSDQESAMEDTEVDEGSPMRASNSSSDVHFEELAAVPVIKKKKVHRTKCNPMKCAVSNRRRRSEAPIGDTDIRRSIKLLAKKVNRETSGVVRISPTALTIMSGMLNDFFHRICKEASKLLNISNRKIMKHETVKSAMKLVLGGGELTKHADLEGSAALLRLEQSYAR